MNTYKLNDVNIPAVATLMSTLKPEWWSYQGALEQLSETQNSINGVGWIAGENEQKPLGWLLCIDFPQYSYLSIECMGYNENNSFVAEHQVEPLLNKAEEYAKVNERRMLKYIISSPQLSCHEQPLGDYWQVLRDLDSNNRTDFDYLIKFGFKPAGFLPNCYSAGCHGVMMIKELI